MPAYTFDEGLIMRIENSMIKTDSAFSAPKTNSINVFKGEDILPEEIEDIIKVSKDVKSDLSVEQKQMILHKSKVTASGWSAFFGVFSTLYYGLRSNNNIARNFALNEKKDKDLIVDIRRNQTLATLPGAAGNLIFGVTSLVTGGLAWLYFKAIENPKNQIV